MKSRRNHTVTRLTKLFVLFIFVGQCVFIHPVSAKGNNDNSIKALVIYSSENGKINENERLLDMLIGHFTSNITFKNSRNVKEKDLEGVSHLFYYGEVKEELPSSTIQTIENFTGPTIEMGYNTGQLKEAYSFLKVRGIQNITSIAFPGNKPVTTVKQEIFDVKTNQPTTNIINTFQNNSLHPLLLKHQNHYYFASSHLEGIFTEFLAESFHDVFEVNHQSVHPAFIRLEDIHPLVNADNVMEIAKLLKKKYIPYMVSVIPIYNNPKTGKEVHFQDSPKLLKALKYMQENGGSIVMHGYTHQYRGRTAEGFEFWDVDNNMRISAPANVSVVKKTREDFKTDQQYKQYQAKNKQFENEYVNTKVNKGIEELTRNGIHPVAFEAPHYAMSQNGYSIVSKYFSNYVGQLQLSDQDWHVMFGIPFDTQPAFLNGMMLIPETMGYVHENNPQSIHDMMETIDRLSLVRDGVYGAFYHPYLGVESFKKLLAQFENVPNKMWIDLKEQYQSKQKHVSTKSNEGKHEINVIKILLWTLVIVAAISVFVFLINIVIIMKVRKKKEGDQDDR